MTSAGLLLPTWWLFIGLLVAVPCLSTVGPLYEALRRRQVGPLAVVLSLAVALVGTIVVWPLELAYLLAVAWDRRDEPPTGTT